jgi:hypothetical protein
MELLCTAVSPPRRAGVERYDKEGGPVWEHGEVGLPRFCPLVLEV